MALVSLFAMLDPRIYRTGLIAVLVAAVVAAFSLNNQPGPLSTTLPPQAFNAQNAFLATTGLARKFHDLTPGSTGDDQLAADVATSLRKDGLSVSTRAATARTAAGTRTIQTVIGTLAGTSSANSIVIVAHRDSDGAPGPASLSGTAVLLELARVLSQQTQQRTIVIASTSGSAGLAGATQLAHSIGTSVDAVISLGDMASMQVRQPVVVPWSEGEQVAPPELRKTVAAALTGQANVAPGEPSFGAQFSHLAFPIAVSEQGPFNAAGVPAVSVSLSGEGPPAPAQTVNPARVGAMGSAMLETVNSLESGSSISAPSAYLLFDGKQIPAWAVKLLVLALILPVLMATIDGLARARRHGHAILPWLSWVLLGAAPFVLAALIVLAARVVGLLGTTPPGPLGAGAVPLGAGGVFVIVLIACVITALLLVRTRLMALFVGARSMRRVANEGAGAAVLLVMCVMAIVVWARNPFAAALMIPALHLWMWVLDPGIKLPRPVAAVLVLLGITPPAFVILYYMNSLGLNPLQAVWNGVLLVAAGYIGLITAVQWGVVLGCLTSVIAIAVRRPRATRARPEETPVTVRGPVTYAGPGSLGGTESALRR